MRSTTRLTAPVELLPVDDQEIEPVDFPAALEARARERGGGGLIEGPNHCHDRTAGSANERECDTGGDRAAAHSPAPGARKQADPDLDGAWIELRRREAEVADRPPLALDNQQIGAGIGEDPGQPRRVLVGFDGPGRAEVGVGARIVAELEEKRRVLCNGRAQAQAGEAEGVHADPGEEFVGHAMCSEAIDQPLPANCQIPPQPAVIEQSLDRPAQLCLGGQHRRSCSRDRLRLSALVVRSHERQCGRTHAERLEHRLTSRRDDDVTLGEHRVKGRGSVHQLDAVGRSRAREQAADHRNLRLGGGGGHLGGKLADLTAGIAATDRDQDPLDPLDRVSPRTRPVRTPKARIAEPTDPTRAGLAARVEIGAVDQDPIPRRMHPEGRTGIEPVDVLGADLIAVGDQQVGDACIAVDRPAEAVDRDLLLGAIGDRSDVRSAQLEGLGEGRGAGEMAEACGPPRGQGDDP